MPANNLNQQLYQNFSSIPVHIMGSLINDYFSCSLLEKHMAIMQAALDQMPQPASPPRDTVLGDDRASCHYIVNTKGQDPPA